MKNKISLFDLNDFDKFAFSFRAVTLHDQWKARVAKVGGKIFMVLGAGGLWGNRIILKTTENSFPILIEQKGIALAPYITRGNWVAVENHSELSDDHLKHYISGSYRLICCKLTQKLRVDLGIDVIC